MAVWPDLANARLPGEEVLVTETAQVGEFEPDFLLLAELPVEGTVEIPGYIEVPEGTTVLALNEFLVYYEGPMAGGVRFNPARNGTSLTATYEGTGSTMWVHHIERLQSLKRDVDVPIGWDELTDVPAFASRWANWSEVTGKPATFPATAHTHPWTEVTGKPATFPPSAHTHGWGEITGVPATFPPSAHTHDWAEVTGKPATFPATAHTHPFSEVTGTIASTQFANNTIALGRLANVATGTVVGRTAAGTGAPSAIAISSLAIGWAQLTGVPATFAPSAHTHPFTEVTGTLADAQVPQSAVTQHQGSLSVAWGQLTGVPATFPASAHTHVWSDITDPPATYAPSAHVHAAADVTTGTFADARIPSLAASKITSGTFADARIAVTSVTQHQGSLAIDWTQLTGRPTTFAPSAHTHPWSEVTATPTTLAGYGILDAAPLAHTHAWVDLADPPATATRWPTWAEVTGKPATFTPAAHTHDWTTDITGKPTEFTPAAHTHTWGEVSKTGSSLADLATRSATDLTTGTLNAARLPTTALQTNAAKTVTALLTFNPTAAGVPFALGANAQGQLVTGLNADLLDGLHASSFVQVGSFAIGNLSDVAITLPAEGDFLIYNASAGRWENQASGGSGGVSVAWGDVTGKPATATRWPDWTEVTGKPTEFTPSAHTHDDRYYTEAETDTLLGGKSNTGHTHTWAEVSKSGSSLADLATRSATDLTTGTLDQARLPATVVLTGTARTITATHTFNPTAAGAPFTLGANAQGQLVTGLNADLLDGLSSAAFALAGHNHDGVYSPAGHNHDAAYAAIGHNHDAAYSPLGHTHDDRYYTETEVNNLLTGYALSGHTHDSRYYTETEIDTMLASYSLATHTHAWTEITGKPATFAPSAHTHPFSEVTGTLANAQVVAGNVTQHQAALSIGWGQLTGVPATFTPSAHVHAAADVTSGTFADVRIPNLNASKITAGTFNDARLSSNIGRLNTAQNYATHNFFRVLGQDIDTTQANAILLATAGAYRTFSGYATANGSTASKAYYFYYHGVDALYADDGVDGFNFWTQGSYPRPVISWYSGGHGSHSNFAADSPILNGYLYQFIKGPQGSNLTAPTRITNANSTWVWGLTAAGVAEFALGITIAGATVATQAWATAQFAAVGHTHAFAELTATPTTLAGYGIADAAPLAHTHAAGDITSGTLADARIPGLTASKITAGTFADARIAASNVTQHAAALAIGWAQLTGVPATFTPSAHTHPFTEITGTATAAQLPDDLRGKGIVQTQAAQPTGNVVGEIWLDTDDNRLSVWDGSAWRIGTAAVEAHTHSWAEITGKPATFAPSAHTHPFTEVTGSIANAQVPAGAVTQHQAALSVAWGQLTAVPATFTPAAHTHAWADITSGKPTTLAGYGITDAAALVHTHANLTPGNGISGTAYNGGAAQTWSIVSHAGTAGSVGTITVTATAIGVTLGTTSTTAAAGNHTHTFASLTSKPTTLAGYGITDAVALTTAANSFSVPQRVVIGTDAEQTYLLELFQQQGTATYPISLRFHQGSRWYQRLEVSSDGFHFKTGNDTLDTYVNVRALNYYADGDLVATQTWASGQFATAAHTHSFASLTAKPTTLAGYGITDAAAGNHTHTAYTLAPSSVEVLGSYQYFSKVYDGAADATYGRAVDRPTSDFKRALGAEFKSRTSIGAPGTGSYVGLLTLAAYSDASSGATHAQLAFAADAIGWRTGTYAGAWGSWETLATQSWVVAGFAAAGHTHAFASLTAKPTTLAGYGITDAAAATHTHTVSQISDITTAATGITSVGTIATGTWNATTISVAKGGTGLTTYTGAGRLIYSTAATTLAALAPGTNGHVLTLAAGLPSWAAPTVPAHTLDSHSNVTITANSSGEILKWNGSAWINNTLAEAGISATGHTHTVSNITDIATAATGITSVGTIATGVWNATTIGVSKGGTGLTTVASGALLYGAGTSALVGVAIGAASTVLTSSGAAPQWSSSLNLAGTLAVSGNVTLSSALVLAATTGLYLDGGGDTYITESAANQVDHVVGGATRLRLSGTGAQFHGGGILYGQPTSWGTFRMTGTTAGYAGIEFDSVSRYLMVNSQYQGIWTGAAWQWLWDNGTLSQGTVPAARVGAGTFGSSSLQLYQFDGTARFAVQPQFPVGLVLDGATYDSTIGLTSTDVSYWSGSEITLANNASVTLLPDSVEPAFIFVTNLSENTVAVFLYTNTNTVAIWHSVGANWAAANTAGTSAVWYDSLGTGRVMLKNMRGADRTYKVHILGA